MQRQWCHTLGEGCRGAIFQDGELHRGTHKADHCDEAEQEHNHVPTRTAHTAKFRSGILRE